MASPEGSRATSPGAGIGTQQQHANRQQQHRQVSLVTQTGTPIIRQRSMTKLQKRLQDARTAFTIKYGVDMDRPGSVGLVHRLLSKQGQKLRSKSGAGASQSLEGPASAFLGAAYGSTDVAVMVADVVAKVLGGAAPDAPPQAAASGAATATATASGRTSPVRPGPPGVGLQAGGGSGGSSSKLRRGRAQSRSRDDRRSRSSGRPQKLTFNLSVLPTSTGHWERDKTLYYTPISALTGLSPQQFASTLRQGMLMYFSPMQQAVALEALDRMDERLDAKAAAEVKDAQAHVKEVQARWTAVGKQAPAGTTDAVPVQQQQQQQGVPVDPISQRVSQIAAQTGVHPDVLWQLLEQELHDMQQQAADGGADADGSGSDGDRHGAAAAERGTFGTHPKKSLSIRSSVSRRSVSMRHHAPAQPSSQSAGLVARRPNRGSNILLSGLMRDSVVNLSDGPKLQRPVSPQALIDEALTGAKHRNVALTGSPLGSTPRAPSGSGRLPLAPQRSIDVLNDAMDRVYANGPRSHTVNRREMDQGRTSESGSAQAAPDPAAAAAAAARPPAPSAGLPPLSPGQAKAAGGGKGRPPKPGPAAPQQTQSQAEQQQQRQRAPSKAWWVRDQVVYQVGPKPSAAQAPGVRSSVVAPGNYGRPPVDVITATSPGMPGAPPLAGSSGQQQQQQPSSAGSGRTSVADSQQPAGLHTVLRVSRDGTPAPGLHAGSAGSPRAGSSASGNAVGSSGEAQQSGGPAEPAHKHSHSQGHTQAARSGSPGSLSGRPSRSRSPSPPRTAGITGTSPPSQASMNQRQRSPPRAGSAGAGGSITGGGSTGTPLSTRYAEAMQREQWYPEAAGATRPGTGEAWHYQAGVYNADLAHQLAEEHARQKREMLQHQQQEEAAKLAALTSPPAALKGAGSAAHSPRQHHVVIAAAGTAAAAAAAAGGSAGALAHQHRQHHQQHVQLPPAAADGTQLPPPPVNYRHLRMSVLERAGAQQQQQQQHHADASLSVHPEAHGPSGHAAVMHHSSSFPANLPASPHAAAHGGAVLPPALVPAAVVALPPALVSHASDPTAVPGAGGTSEGAAPPAAATAPAAQDAAGASRALPAVSEVNILPWDVHDLERLQRETGSGRTSPEDDAASSCVMLELDRLALSGAVKPVMSSGVKSGKGSSVGALERELRVLRQVAKGADGRGGALQVEQAAAAAATAAGKGGSGAVARASTPLGPDGKPLKAFQPPPPLLVFTSDMSDSRKMTTELNNARQVNNMLWGAERHLVPQLHKRRLKHGTTLY